MAWFALRASLVLLVVLALAGIWLFTLGYDEAWILQGISDSVHPRASDLNVAPVVTSGGVYAAVQLVLSYLFGSVLWLDRMLSLSCAIALGFLLWRWGRKLFGSGQGGVLVLAGWAATPGTLSFSATAYGNIPAFLVMLMALHAHAMFAERRIVRVASVGILSGLAAATRPECIALLPALVIFSLCVPGRRVRELSDALLSSTLSSVVFAASVFLYARLGHAQRAVESGASSAGLSLAGLLDYPALLNKWVVGQASLPLIVAVLVTCAGLLSEAWFRREWGKSKLPSAILILVFAWVAWCLWLFRAPIAHLRYLWPSAAAFFLVFGLGIATLHSIGRTRDWPALRLVAMLLGLAGTLSALGGGIRQLVHGESSILSWEWSGESRVTYFTRFRHVQYQRNAAEYLRTSTGRDERVVALGLDRELSFLSGRGVLESSVLIREKSWHPENLPRRVFLSPLMGNYLYLSDTARQWIEANCALEAQFGPYAFYRVIGSYPADPSVLQMRHTTYEGHPMATSWR